MNESSTVSKTEPSGGRLNTRTIMKNSPFKTITSLRAFGVRMTAPLFALLLLATVSCAHAGRNQERDEHGHRPPHVPAGLQVSAGHELQFHVTGVGVQVYVWTQSAANPTQFSWVFKAPHAVLLHHDEDLIGIHFAGPTWQANDGSKVVGRRVASSIVDSNAIPWLLLQAASNDGLGVFAVTTFIQRVKTSGGLAPATPGSYAGQEALVPYNAEYYFYRAH